MSTYEAYQPTLQPTALRGTWGGRWGASLGAKKDELVALAKEAVKSRFTPTAPSDALARMGADRVILRAASEPLEDYRERLAGAWESWGWVGTRYGITRAVGLLGYGYPAVVPVRELPWGPTQPRWARLRVIYTGRVMWGGGSWGSWAWAARDAQGIEALTEAEIRELLRPTLRQWINARDRVEDVIIGRGNPLWGRLVWGAFSWGPVDLASDRISEPAWGEPVWGGFTFGAFC